LGQEINVLIEQAIFTSARTAHGTGYHLVARSAGVTPEEAAELAVWGPSHGSLRREREDATSINFHKLSRGQLCVSKTIAAGEEYSERGGARIYTHFLIVPSQTFAKFANQPFAVLRAAWAKGLLEVPEKLPTALQPFTLAGRTTRVDEGLLAQLAEALGPHGMAQLITAALTPGIKVLTGVEQGETTFGGLFNCLPVECRPEVSFTTYLRFSPRRPFKLVPIDGDHDERRKMARQDGVELVNLSKTESSEQPPRGWAAYVAELVAADHLTTLANELQKSRPSLTLEHLDELGEQLLREFRRTPRPERVANVRSSDQSTRPAQRPNKECVSSDAHDRTCGPATQQTVRAATSAGAIAAPTLIDLGTTKDPVAVDLVEQLDDAVYDAIRGVPAARDLAQSLWLQLSERLPQPTISKLREQYLRYSLSLWEACLDGGMREPEKAAAALDVLSLLFDGE
jgi:hypothetical protein